MDRETKVWTRRQALWLMSGLSGSLALHACTQQTQTSYSTAQSTEAASTELTSATSGSTLWIGYTPVYIALSKGFFQEGGLKLDYKDFSSDTEADAARGAGRLDGRSIVTSQAVTLAEERNRLSNIPALGIPKRSRHCPELEQEGNYRKI